MLRKILILTLLLIAGFSYSQTTTKQSNGSSQSLGGQFWFATNLSDTSTFAGVRVKDALYVGNTLKFYKRTSYWQLQSTIGGGSLDTVTSVSVTSVSVTSANGLAGTVATATTTPAITLSTTITGILKGNGTAISAASAGTDYENPLTFSTGLTRTTNTITINTSQNISTLSNLTSNGLIKTSGGTGSLSIATPSIDYTIPADLTVYLTTSTAANTYMPLTGYAFTTTTGIGQELTSSTLTSGSLLKLTGTSTANLTGAKMFEISSTGANSNSSVTKYGVYSSVTNTGTTSTNIAGYFNASGATSNYSIKALGGNGGGLIFGDYNSTYGAIWSNNVTPINSNYVLISSGATTYFNGTSSLSLAISGSPKLTVSIISTTLANNLIVNSTVSSGTGSTAGFQFNANSLTSGVGIDASTSSLTTGMLAQFQSTSTALSGTNSCVQKIMSTGANANSGVTATGLNISVANTNATSGTNVALQLSASGATTANTAINVTSGYVVLATGTVSPASGSTAYSPVSISATHSATAAASGAFKPLNITYTINNTGTVSTATATGIFLNATETALNGMTHNLMDLQIGAVSKFKVDASGNTTLTGSLLSALFVRAGASSNFQWNGRSMMTSPSDGIILLNNNALSDFGRLQFGGTTSSYPAWARDAANFRLVDASNGNASGLGIGESLPASAKLSVASTTQGFLPPRMTTTQKNAISSPAEGLMVYDTDLHKLYVYDGSTWQAAW